MKKLIFLLLILVSCQQPDITLEIIYQDNTTEKLITKQYLDCNNILRLKCGCTDCIVDSRCNVKSIKVIK